jgi:predicted nucleic acid-binding protein
VAEVVVLDTSACLAFLENEAGAEAVETCLLKAKSGLMAVHASFATLTEVEYITTQERGAADAAKALAKIKAWPLQWHHTDDVLCSEAAKIKAAYTVSLADAFVAATALRVDGLLMHKDPEFRALGALKQQMLPPKTKANP